MSGERLLNLTEIPSNGPAYPCCHQMAEQANFRCSDHPNPFDCGDSLIFYSPVFDEYGLIIHDGGASYLHITHCPWCGVRLPKAKRDLWFETLEELGYDAPLDQNIPKEFTTDAWYRITS